VELPQGRGSGRWLVWLRRSLKNQAEPSFDSSSTSHCPPHTDRTARLNQRSVVERCTLRAPVVVADDAARLGAILIRLHDAMREVRELHHLLLAVEHVGVDVHGLDSVRVER
jgi:hypothetical protein